MTARVRVVPHENLEAGSPTAGRVRYGAFSADDFRLGEVRTLPGALPRPHYQHERTACGYVVSGRLRLHFGPDGGDSVAAGLGTASS
jgi:uncharacterized RmlC-like cupin family protein